jgi:hypothetical protein
MSRIALALAVLALAVAGSAYVVAGDDAPAAKAPEYKAFLTSRIGNLGEMQRAPLAELPELTKILNEIAKEGWRPAHVQRTENDRLVIIAVR